MDFIELTMGKITGYESNGFPAAGFCEQRSATTATLRGKVLDYLHFYNIFIGHEGILRSPHVHMFAYEKFKMLKC